MVTVRVMVNTSGDWKKVLIFGFFLMHFITEIIHFADNLNLISCQFILVYVVYFELVVLLDNKYLRIHDVISSSEFIYENRKYPFRIATVSFI